MYVCVDSYKHINDSDFACAALGCACPLQASASGGNSATAAMIAVPLLLSDRAYRVDCPKRGTVVHQGLVTC